MIETITDSNRWRCPKCKKVCRVNCGKRQTKCRKCGFKVYVEVSYHKKTIYEPVIDKITEISTKVNEK